MAINPGCYPVSICGRELLWNNSRIKCPRVGYDNIRLTLAMHAAIMTALFCVIG